MFRTGPASVGSGLCKGATNLEVEVLDSLQMHSEDSGWERVYNEHAHWNCTNAV